MKKKCLIIVNTIYQLFVAINLRESVLSNDLVDIVLTDKTEKLIEVYKSNILEKYFNGVLLSEKLEECFKGNKLKRVYSRVFNRNIVLNNLEGNLGRYEDLFYFNNNEIFDEILKLLVKRNNKLKLHVFEEGIISYIRNSLPISKVTTFICKYLYNYSINMNEIDLYLFKPEYKTFNDIVNVESICLGNTNLEAINRIFKYNASKISQKYIFFEECIEFIHDKDEYYNLINSIAKKVGYENFTLKRHPRNIGQLKNKNINILKLDYPWEVFAINNDLSDHVLISLSSSSCTNSAMFFDNVKVIMCYNLLKNDTKVTKEINFKKYLTRLETEIEKFYIPKNMDELFKLLD